MEDRARRIVETAVELAEKGGFEAVRLRDVASNAGVALGTLYRRFRSKEDLLLAALEQEIAVIQARVAKAPPAGETPLERVAAFFQLTTRALCRRPNLARALIRSVATGVPGLTQKVTAFHAVMEELITAALRGAPASETESITESERALAFVLQQVWFASLIGWSGGLYDEAEVVMQTRAAARLLLRDGKL